MLTPRLYREYRLKLYLNMNHYIIINGKQGETHPHTWEFSFTIETKSDEFVQFSIFEKVIDEFMAKYQDRVINEVEPFNVMNPTVENVAEYFANETRKLVREKGGQLTCLEASETPTRAYILSFKDDEVYVDEFKEMTDDKISEIVGLVVDQIVDKS